MMENPKLNKPIKKNWIRIIIKVILDLALFVALFIAGGLFYNKIFGGCPSMELVEKCYQCVGNVIPVGGLF